MPVTARRSKAFYERLGEDIADELVAWFNNVDATYRADLRELNELNFARFDSKLEQRLAQFKAEIDRRFVELEAKFDKRFAEQDERLGRRLTDMESRLTTRMYLLWGGALIAQVSLTLALLKFVR